MYYQGKRGNIHTLIQGGGGKEWESYLLREKAEKARDRVQSRIAMFVQVFVHLQMMLIMMHLS